MEEKGIYSKPLDLAAVSRRPITSYEEFYGQYYSRYCRRLVQQMANHQLAEDLVTDSFISLWLHYGSFLTEKAALRFLDTTLQEAIRQNAMVARHQEPGENDRITSNMESEHNLHSRMEWSRLATALQQISQKHRKIFNLYFRYGFSIRQIAHELGNSPSSIQNKLAWSIYILKKYFLKPKAPV
jgi:RNA polymerase sigma factor (sigma-70 family)